MLAQLDATHFAQVHGAAVVNLRAIDHIARGDALRIEQILLNLTSNAVKLTEHGAVALSARRGSVVGIAFTVSDSGPGIASAERERLFGRFEQADGPQRCSGSG